VSRSPLAANATLPDIGSVEDVLELVRAQGGRATSARRVLVQVLFEHAGHLSAEELAEAVQAQSPDVHVSTVYRNLEELERLGVVSHTHLGHGAATYHLAARRHGHLVCEQCGATVEIPVSFFDPLSQQAASRFGFDVDPGHSALMGRCQSCKAH
jgi:Fur family transcriptional regulator, ferric uptake regulator